MRITSILGVLIVAAAGTSACGLTPVVGSGDLVSREHVVEDFDSIEINGAWEASIVVGEPSSVVVLVDDNLVEYVEVDVSGGQLGVDLKRSALRASTSVAITVPSLNAIDVNGASAVSLTGFDGGALKADFNGASTAVLDGNLDEFSVQVNGASTVVATGSANKTEVEVNGASSLQMAGWDTIAVDVDLNGASEAVLTGAETITGSTNGASTLTVTNDAFLDVDISGASDVERR